MTNSLRRGVAIDGRSIVNDKTIMIRKTKPETRLLLILYVLFLFQDCFVAMGLSIFGLYDEILALICVGIIIINIIKNHGVIKESHRGMFLMFLYWTFIIIGVASNLANSDQKIQYILLDILTCSKMILGVAGAKIIFSNGVSQEFKDYLRTVTKIFITVMFVLALHDWFFSPFFQVGYDNAILGLASKFLYLTYSNPTYLAAYSIVALIVLIYTKKNKTPWIFMTMDAVVIILTTRSKAWGFLCLAFLIYWITNKAQSVKSLWNRLIIIIPTGIITVLFIAMDKLTIYFFTPSHYSPRSILLNVGVGKMKKLFPLGNGFGTFCSVAAISTGRETNLLPDNKSAYYDAFWACITGQFGFLGTLVFIIMIATLLFEIMSLIRYDRSSWYVGLFSLAYLIIASFGETSFFSQYSIGFGAFIGMALSCVNDNRTV